MEEHTQEPGRSVSGNNAHEHGNCNLCDDLERRVHRALIHLETSAASVAAARAKLEEGD